MESYYPRVSLADWCRNVLGESIEDSIIDQCQLDNEEMYRRQGISSKGVSGWVTRFFTLYHVCKMKGRACHYVEDDVDDRVPILTAHHLYKICYPQSTAGVLPNGVELLFGDDTINNTNFTEKSVSDAIEKTNPIKDLHIRAKPEEQQLGAASALLSTDLASALPIIGSQTTKTSNTAPWRRKSRPSKNDTDPYLVPLPNRINDALSQSRSQAYSQPCWRSRSDYPQQTDPSAASVSHIQDSMVTSQLASKTKGGDSNVVTRRAITNGTPAIINQADGYILPPCAAAAGLTDAVEVSVTHGYLDQLLQPDEMSEELLQFLVAVDKKWDVMAILRQRHIEPVGTDISWDKYARRFGIQQGREDVLGPMRRACNGKPSSVLIEYVDLKFGIETFESDGEYIEDSS